jgi:hypothetical protein
MRRALIIAVFAVLVANASGVSSLLVPETCPIGANRADLLHVPKSLLT